MPEIERQSAAMQHDLQLKLHDAVMSRFDLLQASMNQLGQRIDRTDDRADSAESRVSELEKTYARVKGGATVLAALASLITGFAGWVFGILHK